MSSLLYFFLKRANANGKHYSIITDHFCSAFLKASSPPIWAYRERPSADCTSSPVTYLTPK